MARFPKDKASRKKRHQTPAAADLPASEGDRAPTPSVEPTSRSTHQQTVIPVLREELTVGKRVVETGKGVRITKSVSEREETVDEPLTKDEVVVRSEEHTSELQSRQYLVCRLLLEKKNN